MLTVNNYYKGLHVYCDIIHMLFTDSVQDFAEENGFRINIDRA